MSAVPIPVPRVVTTTRPSQSRAAPYLASASPAASASLTTVTGRSSLLVKSASASASIHEGSMLAAEPHHAVPDDAGDGDADRQAPVEVELVEQLVDDVGHVVRCRVVGRGDPHPVGLRTLRARDRPALP